MNNEWLKKISSDVSFICGCLIVITFCSFNSCNKIYDISDNLEKAIKQEQQKGGSSTK